MGGDRVLQEAHNLAKMQTAETPLLGHENPSLFPTDFEGVTPRRDVASTPNPLAAASLMGTPISVRGTSDLRTPLRDELGLNVSDTASVTSTRIGAAERAMLRHRLKAQLAQLPKAKNKAEIVMPELPAEDDEMEEEEIELDAVDLQKMKQAAAEEKALEELRKKSQVMGTLLAKFILTRRDRFCREDCHVRF